MTDKDKLTKREVQLIVETVLNYGPPIADDVWRRIEAKLWAQVVA